MTAESAYNELRSPDKEPSETRLDQISHAIFKDYIGWHQAPSADVTRNIRKWMLTAGPNVPLSLCAHIRQFTIDTNQLPQLEEEEIAEKKGIDEYRSWQAVGRDLVRSTFWQGRQDDNGKLPGGPSAGSDQNTVKTRIRVDRFLENVFRDRSLREGMMMGSTTE
jgi:hypothetical protein